MKFHNIKENIDLLILDLINIGILMAEKPLSNINKLIESHDQFKFYEI